MRYFFAIFVVALLTALPSVGARAAEVPEVAATIPFEKFSLGMREAAVKALGAETDSDGDLVASANTGEQQWMIVLSLDKGKVSQFSLAARSDTPHFSAAVDAIAGQGYVPAKISVGDKEVELLALGAGPEADAKRQAVFEDFLNQAEKGGGPAAAVFMKAADFSKALKMSLPEVTAKLASSPVFLLRHNAEGMTVIVCTTLASMAEPEAGPGETAWEKSAEKPAEK